MDLFLTIDKMLSNTFTISDSYKRVLLLEEYLQYAFFSGEQKQHPSTASLRERYKDSREKYIAEAVAQWGDSFLASFNAENTHGAIQAMKEAVSALPLLTLYAPVVFDPPQIAEISSWCRSNIAPKLILDLRVDPAVTGGCTFVWKDVLYDFSLKYFMQKYQKEFDAIVRTLPSAAVAK